MDLTWERAIKWSMFNWERDRSNVLAYRWEGYYIIVFVLG